MERLTRIVRNQSPRGSARPRLMVLHTTEGHNRPGTADLRGLAEFFDQPNGSSSHKAVDAEGNIITMVADSQKAFTQCNFNSVSLAIEQIGFASQSKKEWVSEYHRGLRTVARQLAHWSIRHDIPLRHSTVSGVCQHSNLGAIGCGHSDCGPGYPEKYVILWARLWALRFTGKHKQGAGRARALAYKQRIHRQQKIHAGRVLGTD